MSQVIRALVYMHETAMICHRDLKVTRCSEDGGPRYACSHSRHDYVLAL